MFGRSKKQSAQPEEPAYEDVPIREDMIRLGQFLKLANLVEHGGQAKEVIAAGSVEVNGEVCTQRGKQLHAGDLVSFDGQTVRLVNEADFEDNLPW
jgi:ribosome-associated protein